MLTLVVAQPLKKLHFVDQDFCAKTQHGARFDHALAVQVDSMTQPADRKGSVFLAELPEGQQAWNSWLSHGNLIVVIEKTPL